jgi:hypothetical protein
MNFSFSSLPETVLVELPCFCDDITKVENMFGGEESLKITLREKHAALRLSLSSEPSRPPFLGKHQSNQGVIVSMKKWKSGKVECLPLGCVTDSYKFRTFPDYQVINPV